MSGTSLVNHTLYAFVYGYKTAERDFRNPMAGAAGGEGESEGDLRGSVTTLLDAMQVCSLKPQFCLDSPFQ